MTLIEININFIFIVMPVNVARCLAACDAAWASQPVGSLVLTITDEFAYSAGQDQLLHAVPNWSHSPLPCTPLHSFPAGQFA